MRVKIIVIMKVVRLSSKRDSGTVQERKKKALIIRQQIKKSRNISVYRKSCNCPVEGVGTRNMDCSHLNIK